MKKLRRFNPIGLRRIEFRENPDGIRVYELNWRNYEYTRYLGLIRYIEFYSVLIFDFEPNYLYFKFNSPPWCNNVDSFNEELKKIWGEHAYLTEEAVNYLESIYLMKKLTR